MSSVVAVHSTYYDNFGVLRRGADSRNRDTELELVLAVEEEGEAGYGTKDTENLPALAEDWRVVNAFWIESWLGFVHFEKERNAPGPIRNEDLLEFDDVEQKWVPKPSLVCAGGPAGTSGAGHYRLLRKETWDLYCMLYPGSGPEITVRPPIEMKNWIVDTRMLADIHAAAGKDAPHVDSAAATARTWMSAAPEAKKDEGVPEAKMDRGEPRTDEPPREAPSKGRGSQLASFFFSSEDDPAADVV